jgi:hypothetical protein
LCLGIFTSCVVLQPNIIFPPYSFAPDIRGLK